MHAVPVTVTVWFALYWDPNFGAQRIPLDQISLVTVIDLKYKCVYVQRSLPQYDFAICLVSRCSACQESSMGVICDLDEAVS